MAECLGLLRQGVVAATRVWVRGLLGGLIVGLNGGQFINELFTAFELAYFRKVNYGEPVSHFGVFLIGDHAISQFAFG